MTKTTTTQQSNIAQEREEKEGNDENKYAAIATDWEDDECLCRQSIKTTINLSSQQ